jgi:hypothetical protein
VAALYREEISAADLVAIWCGCVAQTALMTSLASMGDGHAAVFVKIGNPGP